MIRVDSLKDCGTDEQEVIRTISFTVSGADARTLEHITSEIDKRVRRYISSAYPPPFSSHREARQK